MIKRLTLSILFLLLFTFSAQSAITIGQATSASNDDADPVTMSHDNDTNDFLMAGVVQETSGSADPIPATGSTYDSVAITAIGNDIKQDQLQGCRWYYQTSPSSEINTLSIDVGTAESDQALWAVSFDGVDGADPIGTEATKQGSGSNHSFSYTTTEANVLLVAYMLHEDSEAATENSGEGWTAQIDTTSGSQIRMQILTLPAATVGTYDISWSVPEDDYIIRIIELNPAGGAPPSVKRRVILQ